MSRRLIIHAPNVHQGGGRILLLSLLTQPLVFKILLIVDERMVLPENLAQNIQVKRIKPSVIARFLAEKWLHKNVTQNDITLFFGNLPPLFPLKGITKLFVQNRYLVDDTILDGFNWRSKFRLKIEKLWFNFGKKNIDSFIVQTSTMQHLLNKKNPDQKLIRILPFVPDLILPVAPQTERLSKIENEYHFVYIASGEPHKNHRTLFEAWYKLASDGIYPFLHTTLRSNDFEQELSKLRSIDTTLKPNIRNQGNLKHHEVFDLYKKSSALIFPSTLESFGLPLIEAKNCGLPILASEMDYVRDIVDPVETFDPGSSLSIARAVKRFMRQKEPRLNILNAEEFLEQVLDVTK